MHRAILKKRLRKWTIAVVVTGGVLYFVPYLAFFYFATGLLDVLRNERKDRELFDRYFLGNGLFTTWLFSPVNLLIDLLCYRNRKIYGLEDFSEECREEIEGTISVFVARRAEIIAQVDRTFEAERRGMFVYRWFGRQYNEEIADFNKSFKYLQTIAVSVFEGKESTSFHFGPFRPTLRILYNLTPVESEKIFIECGRTKHYWHERPLFIFDDTLMHRSANENEGRRYCVFMDVIRPSPVPALLSALLRPCSAVAHRGKSIFYRKWKMLGASDTPQDATTKS